MGCNSDHMNPTEKEKNNKEACGHIVYLCEKNGKNPIHWALKGASELYGSHKPLNEVVYALCQMCKETSEDIIYNGKDPKARKLADWWDAHQEADRKRIAKEEEAVRKEELKIKTLAKLTDEERWSIGYE
jgi:hypothetical protein